MLSEKLGKVLGESGLTQSEFAQKAGIDYERFKNMLHGKVQRIKPDEALRMRGGGGIG